MPRIRHGALRAGLLAGLVLAVASDDLDLGEATFTVGSDDS